MREAAEAIARYRSALTALEQRRAGASVEKVYDAALALEDPLVSPARDEDAIHRLPEAELRVLEAQLRGIKINTDELIYARPDPAFFLQLAQQHGRAADIAFFNERNVTYPTGLWPVYQEHLSEISDCTDFESGQLVARYGAWRAYRRKFPRAYVAHVSQELELIEDQMKSTCACGKTLPPYVRELGRFNHDFPDNPVRNNISKLLDDAEHGRATVTLSCEGR